MLSGVRDGWTLQHVVSAIPDAPLPPPALARVAVLGAGPRRDALADGLDVGTRRCLRLGWREIGSRRLADVADVVVVADSWDAVSHHIDQVVGDLADVVVIAAVDVVVGAPGDSSVVGPAEGTTPTLAARWDRSRVVGAFHQLTVEHLQLAAVGSLRSDVPVIGDDREAVDLVEGLIDDMTGLEAVYAGRLTFAAVVEGFAAIVREVGASSGEPVGFRFGEAGLRFLY